MKTIITAATSAAILFAATGLSFAQQSTTLAGPAQGSKSDGSNFWSERCEWRSHDAQWRSHDRHERNAVRGWRDDARQRRRVGRFDNSLTVKRPSSMMRTTA